METRPINKNDFELLLDLDRKVYPTDEPVTEDVLSMWYNKNPEFGIVFEEDEEIIGMGIVIPLNQIGWEKLVKGELAESELNDDTLFDKSRDKKIFLHIYHIEKLKQIEKFHEKFLVALNNVLPKNVEVGGFSGLCVTSEGIGLFENKLNCKEREFQTKEHILEKDGKLKLITSGENKEKIEEENKGYKYLNRCEMLLLYPNEKSVVWDFLNKKNKEDIARDSIMVESEEVEGVSVKGYDFNDGVDYSKILDSFSSSGAQAINFAKAVEIIKEMRKEKAFIYLGYTSNMVSTGNREIIRYLVEHKLVDILVTTCGGIEEDFMKCMGDFKVGDFKLDGKDLRKRGINRIGNLLVPNSRYCKFEDFVIPILEKFNDKIKTPSDLIKILGKEIGNKESIYYWAQKNKIPVFCPVIMDGSLGDMIYFYKSSKNSDFKIDIVADTEELNNSTIGKDKTGMIVLGAGVVKHSICNANLYRNGADYAVYVNTAQEFDASDSGARPDEAVSWGKIGLNAKSVKVHGDATILFPLLVAKAFIENNNP